MKTVKGTLSVDRSGNFFVGETRVVQRLMSNVEFKGYCGRFVDAMGDCKESHILIRDIIVYPK